MGWLLLNNVTDSVLRSETTPTPRLGEPVRTLVIADDGCRGCLQPTDGTGTVEGFTAAPLHCVNFSPFIPPVRKGLFWRPLPHPEHRVWCLSSNICVHLSGLLPPYLLCRAQYRFGFASHCGRLNLWNRTQNSRTQVLDRCVNDRYFLVCSSLSVSLASAERQAGVFKALHMLPLFCSKLFILTPGIFNINKRMMRGI